MQNCALLGSQGRVHNAGGVREIGQPALCIFVQDAQSATRWEPPLASCDRVLAVRFWTIILTALPLAAAPASINVSHDLTTLGIASRNMTPNVSTLDSAPLFTAAVNYANTHSIPTVTADPGSYYFLSGNTTSGRYLNFNGLSNLTVDLAQSDLYFAGGSWTALWCEACTNVEFRNFTIDALQLPFTQVMVSSVDTRNNRINYSPIFGWEAATDFNTVRNPTGATEPLYAFAFRNGLPLRTTSRMVVQRPIDPAYLPIVSDGSPWSNPSQLAAIQPGDIVVLEARAGGPAFSIHNGSKVTVHNVAIYYGSQVGLNVQAAPDSMVDQVQIIPRPGTDRLVSTNADGITAVQLGQNLTIQNCRVRRNGDDGISPNSQSLALTVSQPAPNQVAVTRSAFSNFPDGLAVQFIDNKTGQPAVTANIVSQNPPYSTATPAFNGAATITFDQNIPALALHDPMVYADPTYRGSGLLIQNNLVEENAFARGLSLWGLTNVTVQGNSLRNTSWSAINLLESLSTASWLTGPISNFQVNHNALEQYVTAFGSGVDNNYGAISIGANDVNLALVSNGSPFQNISINNNFISTGPYSGVHMQDVSNGQIDNNLMMNVCNAPTANNPNNSVVSQLSQPVSVVSSVNVSQTSGAVDSKTPPALVSSAVSFSNEAAATDSWTAIIGTNLAPKTDIASADPLPTTFDGVTVTITDSSGTDYPAGVWYISSRQINFLMPAGPVNGAAIVTVAVNGSPTGRGAILIDNLAPAMFSYDGSGTGLALGAAVLTDPSGNQTITPLNQQINVGKPGDVLTLVLYASGIRHLDSQENVQVYLGGQRLTVSYAGAQPAYQGLDQINVNVPASLAGSGTIPLRVVVDGFSSNTVAVNIM